MQLTNWTIDGERLEGELHGSDRYPDGTVVKTSRVITCAYDGELLLIKTEHSVYECAEKDYIGDPEQLLIFIRTTVNDAGGTTRML